jgi:hypothetical protein
MTTANNYVWRKNPTPLDAFHQVFDVEGKVALYLIAKFPPMLHGAIT